MYHFNYHQATSVAEAAKLLRDAADAKLLAGGRPDPDHEAAPAPSRRDLVDLGGIAELKGIKRDGNAIVIGAMTRHAEVARIGRRASNAIPALAQSGRAYRRSRGAQCGTLGGSIANNDPAADYPAAVLGLGATVITNKRKIAADEFFTGMFETALETARS